MTKKCNMTVKSFISMLEDERRGRRDVCGVISRLLSENNYADGFEEGCVEGLFKDTYDNNLLSKEELRHFFIILHQRFAPYKYLRDDIISIIKNLNPPILDCFAEIETRWIRSIPDNVTLFRGLHSDYVDIQQPGLCWSTNKDRATSFCQKKGMLLTSICDKSDILCFFQGTDEYEVVLPEDRIQLLRIDRVFDSSQNTP